MGPLRIVFRAELRRRWQSWLALAFLLAVVGGVVLAILPALAATRAKPGQLLRTQ